VHKPHHHAKVADLGGEVRAAFTMETPAITAYTVRCPLTIISLIANVLGKNNVLLTVRKNGKLVYGYVLDFQ